MNLKNLGIRAKLMGGFGLVLAIALGQSLLSMQQLHRVNDKSTEIADNWLPSVKVLGDLNDDLSQLRLARVKLTMIEESSKVEPLAQQIAKLQDNMGGHMAKYAKLISSPEEKALYTELDTQLKAYNAQSPQLIKLMRELNALDAKALVAGDGSKAYDAADAQLDKLIEMNAKGAEVASDEADAIYARARVMLLAGLVVMVGLGLGIAWVVSRNLVAAAASAVKQAERIADGDLTHSVQADSRDEMGQLLEALGKMQGRLRDIVSGVRQNAEGVATASAEIAQGNQDLSGRTEQQASALEETAASMEELASTVKQNADNARQANQLAMSASTVAVSGGDVVNRVVETMRGIEESSKRIADIIGTIDGIAFQTNILALNAAVEAARAGEQGRGFAVVASEVRSLAQRSAEAAKEIKSLISTSVERVEQGTTLADQAGTTMQEVVSSIKRVTDIMGEISSASTEQSAGVAQVGEAVAQMDQATQQNAALVEESAAAAESLKGQAEKLVGAVAVFKLANGDAPRAQAAPVAAKPAQVAKAAPAVKPAAPIAKPAAPAAEAKPAPVAAAPVAPKAAPAPAPAMAATADDDWETF